MSCSGLVFMLFQRSLTCWHTIRRGSVCVRCPGVGLYFGSWGLFLLTRAEKRPPGVKRGLLRGALECKNKRRRQSSFLWSPACPVPHHRCSSETLLWRKNSSQAQSIMKMHRTGSKAMAWMKIQKIWRLSEHIPFPHPYRISGNHYILNMVIYYSCPSGCQR